MVCVNILTNRSERAWIDHRKRDNCRTKASPVQGEVSAEQADGGDVAERCYDFALDYGEYEGRTAHPLSQKSKIFASSPYTGEPFGRCRAGGAIGTAKSRHGSDGIFSLFTLHS